jgi:CRISPR/Cas system-associated exonuclease Cas4 (RecB family)
MKKETSKEITYLPGERWREIKLDQANFQKRYAISNYGRVVSYLKTIKQGYLLKLNKSQGYLSFSLNYGDYAHRIFPHRLVAEYFLKLPSKKHTKVIFKNYDSNNCHVDNIAWATPKEQQLHSVRSPKAIKARKKLVTRFQKDPKGKKLKVSQVIKIKEMLFKKPGKYTLRKIAEKFDISDMQVYRIKTGENWSYVKWN